MSLTQAITLNEATGTMDDQFSSWYENSKLHKKTIFDALDQFTRPINRFDFAVGFDFIYPISENLHFVPSVEDLYWTELEVFSRDGVKDFIHRLLEKITNSNKLPKYEYILFDCPPSFTILSYSVLSCCDLILIPVNPDFFASKGTNLILNSLKLRIEPYPLPKVGVFMNKTKTHRGNPTAESANFMRELKRICEEAVNSQGIQSTFFESWIPERVGIKRALPKGNVPEELIEPFKRLWKEVIEFLS